MTTEVRVLSVIYTAWSVQTRITRGRTRSGRCSTTHHRHPSVTPLPLPRLQLLLVFAYEEREDDQVEESHNLRACFDNDVVFIAEESQVSGVRPCYDRVRA